MMNRSVEVIDENAVASLSPSSRPSRARTSSAGSFALLPPNAKTTNKPLSLLSKLLIVALPVILHRFLLAPLLLSAAPSSITASAVLRLVPPTENLSPPHPAWEWAAESLEEAVKGLIGAMGMSSVSLEDANALALRPGMLDFMYSVFPVEALDEWKATFIANLPPAPKFIAKHPYVAVPLILVFLGSLLSFLKNRASVIRSAKTRGKLKNNLDASLGTNGKRRSRHVHARTAQGDWYSSLPARVATDLVAWVCLVESVAFQGGFVTLVGRLLMEFAGMCFLLSQTLAAWAALGESCFLDKEEAEEANAPRRGRRRSSSLLKEMRRQNIAAEIIKAYVPVVFSTHLWFDMTLITRNTGLSSDALRFVAYAMTVISVYACFKLAFKSLLPLLWSWARHPNNSVLVRMENQDTMRLLATGVILVFLNSMRWDLALVFLGFGLVLEPRRLSESMASLFHGSLFWFSLDRDSFIQFVMIPGWFALLVYNDWIQGQLFSQSFGDQSSSSVSVSMVLLVLFIWFDQLYAVKREGKAHTVGRITRAVVLGLTCITRAIAENEHDLKSLLAELGTFRTPTFQQDIQVLKQIVNLVLQESITRPIVCLTIGFIPSLCILLWEHPMLRKLLRMSLAILTLIVAIRFGIGDTKEFIQECPAATDLPSVNGQSLYAFVRTFVIAKSLWSVAAAHLLVSCSCLTFNRWTLVTILFDTILIAMAAGLQRRGVSLLFMIPFVLEVLNLMRRTKRAANVAFVSVMIVMSLIAGLGIIVMQNEQLRPGFLPAEVEYFLDILKHESSAWKRVIQDTLLMTHHPRQGIVQLVFAMVINYIGYLVCVQTLWHGPRMMLDPSVLRAMNWTRTYWWMRLAARVLEGSLFYAISAWFMWRFRSQTWSLGDFLGSYACFLCGTFVLIRATLHVSILQPKRSSSLLTRSRMSFWFFNVLIDFGLSQIISIGLHASQRGWRITKSVTRQVYRSPAACLTLSGAALIELFVITEYVIPSTNPSSTFSNPTVEVTSAQGISMVYAGMYAQAIRDWFISVRGNMESLVERITTGSMFRFQEEEFVLQAISSSAITPYAVYVGLVIVGKTYSALSGLRTIHLVSKTKTLLIPLLAFVFYRDVIRVSMALSLLLSLSYFSASLVLSLYELRERHRAEEELKEWLQLTGRGMLMARSPQESLRGVEEGKHEETICRVCSRVVQSLENKRSVGGTEMFKPEPNPAKTQQGAVEAGDEDDGNRRLTGNNTSFGHVEMTCCGAAVHLECLEDWLTTNQRCPVCFHPQEFPLSYLNAVL